jgi:hypothetical protein
MRSKPLWANKGVGEIGEKEQGDSTAEDVIDNHLAVFPVKGYRRLLYKPAIEPRTKRLFREQ